MLLFHLCLLTSLLHSISSSLASPPPSVLPSAFLSTPLIRRAQYCANAPATQAGNRLDRRSSLLLPRVDPPGTIWCAPYSNTFVSLITLHVIPTSASGMHNDVLTTLYTAWDIARTHVDQSGDGIIGYNGGYTLVGDAGIRLSAWNRNNHQLTWGVLGAALMAVMDYMRVKNWYGTVTFDIYDGVNNVATAFLA